jgi:hypothetical protein
MDADYIILHKSTPRTIVQELTLDLSCPEQCFQANTAQECHSHLVTLLGGNSRPLLSEAVALLCRGPPLGDATKVMFSHMSTMNLFTMIAGEQSALTSINSPNLQYEVPNANDQVALHLLIFHQHMLCTYLPAINPRIYIALDRWKCAWDAKQALDGSANATFPTEDWRGGGFMECADELRVLALAMLEKINSASANGGSPSENNSQDSLVNAGKFDDTSMGQISDLMSSFHVLSMTQDRCL